MRTTTYYRLFYIFHFLIIVVDGMEWYGMVMVDFIFLLFHSFSYESKIYAHTYTFSESSTIFSPTFSHVESHTIMTIIICTSCTGKRTFFSISFRTHVYVCCYYSEIIIYVVQQSVHRIKNIKANQNKKNVVACLCLHRHAANQRIRYRFGTSTTDKHMAHSAKIITQCKTSEFDLKVIYKNKDTN